MRVRVNGEERCCKENCTVQELLLELALNPTTVIVECNGAILPAETFADARLAEGDSLELLQFVGGG